MGRVGEQEQLCLFDLGVDVARLKTEARELVALGAGAPNTDKAYLTDWRLFEAWCAAAGRSALPSAPETVCLYLTDVARRCKVGTVTHHAFAIARIHLAGGHSSPVNGEVRQLLTGLRRARGSEVQPKAALLPEQLRAISKLLDRRRPVPARDAAVLILGFATGLRRSDLVSLDVQDLRFVKAGLIVRVGRLRREKNDQAGDGREIGVFPGRRRETCPLRAIEAWLSHRGRKAGALFTRLDESGKGERLHPSFVGVIVQRAVGAIGLDPAEYGAHSLRAGMVTECAIEGASDSSIMLRSGHRSVEMIKRYRRHRDLFYANPLANAL